MNKKKTEKLANAIVAIYPDIAKRIGESKDIMDENGLWWELSTCILSSQVPYETAVAASDALEKLALLTFKYGDLEELYPKIQIVLNTPLEVNERLLHYRFANARANQLAKARVLVTNYEGTLRELLNRFETASEARDWLVKNMPGLGPKQASMFLRNTGTSYELAILDRHVLNYMTELGIYEESSPFISGISKYRYYEEKLRKHAGDLNCNLGMLDWAIWIVMRVANKNRELLEI
jgi:N-glycosylase/DNA lyase